MNDAVKLLLVLSVAFATLLANAQAVSRSRLLGGRGRPAEGSDKILVALMPFPEAAQKAKDGDGAGLYAVALHYAKGMEIGVDKVKAGKYLRRAVEKNDPNAVFVNAMAMEDAMKCPRPRLENGPSDVTGWFDFGEDDKTPVCELYTGGVRAWEFKGMNYSFVVTNMNDVAMIADAYKLADNLGVKYATNELARFMVRVSVINDAIEKRMNAIKAFNDTLSKNALLAEELLGETQNIPTVNASGSRGLGSLRERRAQREQARAEEKAAAEERARIAAEKEAQRDAELAAEREQREREREEQRAQLMQIQNELNKAREERERAASQKDVDTASQRDTIDTKVKAFLKEYADISFGDSADSFPEFDGSNASINMKKNFKYFDKALATFTNKKLTSVEFYCYVDKKYSYNSSKEQLEKTVGEMLVSWGFPADYFSTQREFDNLVKPTFKIWKYGFEFDDQSVETWWRFSMSISDRELYRRTIQEEKTFRANAGVALPEIR